MPNWSSGDVIANGIRIRYTRTGGDKLPLVLSHGFSDNGLCWTRLVKVLERDYDIIMVDARGHGLSEAPEGGHDADTRAADLAGVVTALGLGKAALMGHSMGASTVAATAANHPQVVRRDPRGSSLASRSRRSGCTRVGCEARAEPSCSGREANPVSRRGRSLREDEASYLGRHRVGALGRLQAAVEPPRGGGRCSDLHTVAGCCSQDHMSHSAHHSG